jgi:hypothetical protein
MILKLQQLKKKLGIRKKVLLQVYVCNLTPEEEKYYHENNDLRTTNIKLFYEKELP